MKITRKVVAGKIAGYLHHKLALADLVDWAERAVMDGDFEKAHAPILAAVVGRLGAADVRNFGLEWGDCAGLLRQLGFAARVAIIAA